MIEKKSRLCFSVSPSMMHFCGCELVLASWKFIMINNLGHLAGIKEVIKLKAHDMRALTILDDPCSNL